MGEACGSSDRNYWQRSARQKTLKILFIHQGLQSFVQKDLDILRSAHEVCEVWFGGLRSVPAICSGAKWADVTFSWFGKLHAFFAVLFSKLLGGKPLWWQVEMMLPAVHRKGS